MASSNQKTYELVTDRICALLERGVVPWRQPWESGTLPGFNHCNVISRKTYRGVNALMTFATALDRGYALPYWLTFKQALDLGGNVRKGEHGIPIIYVNKFTKTEQTSDGDEVTRQIPFLKHFTVFNIAQCENLPAELLAEISPKPEPAALPQFTPIERCEQIIAGMPQRPQILHNEPRAYYRPSLDYVNLPKPELFTPSTAYYATAFHELTHSTGHASRLDRHANDLAAGRQFGSEPYAREELVAEIGSAFLCAMAGIDQVQIENSAAYVASWLKALRNDQRMIISAAAHAQRAADFILNAAAADESAAA